VNLMETQRVAISVQRGTRKEQFELQAGTLRIGSASHCDVRLLPDEAAPEQLLLAKDARGLLLRALCHEPLVRLDGATLTQAVIQSGATLEVGALRLGVQLLQTREHTVPHAALLKHARLVAMLIGIALLGYTLLSEPEVQSAFARPVPAPKLFAGGPSECGEAERDAARVLAREQLSAAASKRERAPFSARDGVQAVPLYASAAACFRAAEEHELARDSEAEGHLVAAELQQELHAHQARLEWFLARASYAAAAQEVMALRELVAGRSDAHAAWLAAVTRELPHALVAQEQAKP
jgi:hypothetical protein